MTKYCRQRERERDTSRYYYIYKFKMVKNVNLCVCVWYYKDKKNEKREKSVGTLLVFIAGGKKLNPIYTQLSLVGRLISRW